jgi:hypothetical protein
MSEENNPDDIIKVIRHRNQMLSEKNDELIRLSDNMADAKRKYAIAFAALMVAMREDKKPATLIADLARGDELVAQLRYEKDIAKGLHDAQKEQIKDIRILLDSYRSILAYQKEEKFSRNI